MFLWLLFRFDDLDGRESGALRAGRLLGRFFRCFKVLFLIFPVERLEHLLFGLWPSFFLPFETAKDHVFRDDPSHGRHRAFGIAAEDDAVQLSALRLPGGIQFNIAGRVQFGSEDHVDDIAVGPVRAGIGLFIVGNIVNALRVPFGADIVDFPALEKAVESRAFQLVEERSWRHG